MAIDTRAESADKPSGEKKSRTTPALFYRQVVNELRKVIWPTRKDLITYTTVVLIFVLIVVGIVYALDWALGELVLRVFS
ncbi:preprotein translocase subunit SecE [Nonomuraea sp. NPDC050663]|uniref:Protein translocase subunit SecE n=1 Tax=Nonomuraea soli TaxID=1032476 RepID=A0A7W0HVK3_9ACTN|nr:preprotein translocase subunit SecE [Nonomuraea soli]MBA2897127.1 preprotein translocase subunit SecE [Nonomuraea soli]